MALERMAKRRFRRADTSYTREMAAVYAKGVQTFPLETQRRLGIKPWPTESADVLNEPHRRNPAISVTVFEHVEHHLLQAFDSFSSEKATANQNNTMDGVLDIFVSEEKRRKQADGRIYSGDVITHVA